MTARKNWSELAPVTRNNRFAVIAANHLPSDKRVVPFASKHSRCANRGNCTGPGCRVNNGR